MAIARDARAQGLRLAMDVRVLPGGERIAVDADRPMVAASLAKLPIMVAAFELAERGELDLEEPVAVCARDLVGGSGVLVHLGPGVTARWGDLVALMIIVSDNSATNLLLRRIGTRAVAEAAGRLGLVRTVIQNPLEVQRQPAPAPNTTTARDMAQLLSALVLGQAVSRRASARMVDLLTRQQDRSRLQSRLPDPASPWVGGPPRFVVGSKSGHITGIHHDVGFVLGPDTGFVLALLAEGMPADARRAAHILGTAARRVFDALWRES